jgi:hypothetical protein
MKKVIFFIVLLITVLTISIYPPQESKAAINIKQLKDSTEINIYTDSISVKQDSIKILVKELLHQDTVLKLTYNKLKK